MLFSSRTAVTPNTITPTAVDWPALSMKDSSCSLTAALLDGRKLSKISDWMSWRTSLKAGKAASTPSAMASMGTIESSEM